MKVKKLINKTYGGIIFLIGFLLSPLSWWNDILINLPLSYLVAWPFGTINKNLFMPVMVSTYWATNILGFVLMHYGSRKIIEKEKSSKNLKYELIKILIISGIYTLLIIALILLDVLKLPGEYFK